MEHKESCHPAFIEKEEKGLKQTQKNSSKFIQLIEALLLLLAMMLTRLLLAAAQKAIDAIRTAAEKRFAGTAPNSDAAEKEEK